LSLTLVVCCLPEHGRAGWARLSVYPATDILEKPQQAWGTGGRYQDHTEGRALRPADDSAHAEAHNGYLPEWWEAKTNALGRTEYRDHLNQVTCPSDSTASECSKMQQDLPTQAVIDDYRVGPLRGALSPDYTPDPLPKMAASNADVPNDNKDFNYVGMAAAIQRARQGGGAAEANRDAYEASSPKNGGPETCQVAKYTLYVKTDECMQSQDFRTCLESETTPHCSSSEYRSAYFNSSSRQLHRYYGSGNCSNSPVESFVVGNCTQVGAQRYTILDTKDSYMLPDYHPFKVKYATSDCSGNITELWMYDGCFQRRLTQCVQQNSYKSVEYHNDNCTYRVHECSQPLKDASGPTSETPNCDMEISLFTTPEESVHETSIKCVSPTSSSVPTAQQQSTSIYYPNANDYTNEVEGFSWHSDLSTSYRDYQCGVLHCGQGLSHDDCTSVW